MLLEENVLDTSFDDIAKKNIILLPTSKVTIRLKKQGIDSIR